MQEENYLEKLRAIREKYGTTGNHQYVHKHTQVQYPLSQKIDHSSQFRNTSEHVTFNASPVRRERAHFEEQSRLQSRCERPYSMERHKTRDYSQMKGLYQDSQVKEVQRKRQDNFQHFISDLDQRLEEKNRKLTDTFKENEKILRRFEECPQEQAQRKVSRYASTKEFKSTRKPERQQLKIMPRAAYEKSVSYRNHHEPLHLNNQNQVPLKDYMTNSPVGKKNRNYELLMKEDLKRAYIPSSSQDIISKKLDGPLNLNKDGWCASKLDSIQSRIHSVLKQANR